MSTRRYILKYLIPTFCIAATSSLGFLYRYANIISILSISIFLLLFKVASKLDCKRYYGVWSLFGLIYFTIVLSWVYNIKATELINDGYLSTIFLVFTFALMIGVFSVGTILVAFTIRKLKISTEDKSILLIPFIWVVCEYLRSILFSVFFIGDGGSIGPFWNFGTTGLLITDTPLKYSSRIIGLYGQSFIVIIIAISIYKLIARQWRYSLLLFIPMIISLMGWFLYSNPSGQKLSAKSVSIPGKIETGYAEALKKIINNAGHTDLLVLPEYSRFFIDETGTKTNYTLPNTTKLVIDSASSVDEMQISNKVSYYNHNGEVLKQYKKWFLIPGGEYIPYIYHMILFYSGNRNLIDQFHSSNAVNMSGIREQPFQYNDITYGALACSGAIAPSLYRNLTSSGAEVLINSASISTLGVSETYYFQATHMSKFIATANARPYIQSSRGGPSYILNKDGATDAFVAESDKLKTIDSTVKTNSKQTIYSKLGEWLIPISTLVIVLYFIKMKNHKKSLLKP